MRSDSRARKEHPFVKLLREVRVQHSKQLLEMETCMGVKPDSLRQIENGRQRLPGIQPGPKLDLATWLKRWMTCVEATNQERESVEELLMLVVLGRLTDDLPPGDGRDTPDDGGGRS